MEKLGGARERSGDFVAGNSRGHGASGEGADNSYCASSQRNEQLLWCGGDRPISMDGGSKCIRVPGVAEIRERIRASDARRNTGTKAVTCGTTSAGFALEHVSSGIEHCWEAVLL